MDTKGDEMTTKEAMQSMLDGKKVRNKTWSSYIYMYFDGDILVNYNGIKFNNLSMSFTDDWEIYEEPKPKQIVVIEKWLVTNGKRFDVAETSDIDAYLGEGVGWRIVKLLKTYEEEI